MVFGQPVRRQDVREARVVVGLVVRIVLGRIHSIRDGLHCCPYSGFFRTDSCGS